MKHSHPLLVGAGLLALATQAQAQQRPNVIVLVADDLGYGDLSCYGANRVSTPRVDSIANSGVRFTDAHAVASTSTPHAIRSSRENIASAALARTSPRATRASSYAPTATRWHVSSKTTAM